MTVGNPVWARRVATGLLGRARALLHGLGPKGEHPSRRQYARMAKLPTIELTRKVTEFAVDHRGNDVRATAELAFRWGYMHGQWDAREELTRRVVYRLSFRSAKNASLMTRAARFTSADLTRVDFGDFA